MKLQVSDLFVFAIRRFSHVNGYTDEFKVTGYTTYKVKDNSKEDSVKYYTTEYMNGGKRYDYAMINFVSDEGMTETCPSKILGFVRYNTLAARGLEEWRNFKELLTESVGRVHFS
jgi:hypothetical protein